MGRPKLSGHLRPGRYVRLAGPDDDRVSELASEYAMTVSDTLRELVKIGLAHFDESDENGHHSDVERQPSDV